MCVGEKRRLIIPSELAYGPMGSGDLIPPNSAVIFEIELLGISSIWTNPWMWLNLGALIAAFLYYIRMAQREELEKLKRAEERKALETQPAKSTAGRQGTTTHKPNEAKKDD
ncbi:hypothetical protein BC936DRAFT_145807 [Jimgerdemannia flammicorona]|uniref:peptidylprolyl isomerase n=1 Tax=Jimgerdemannia flammicorona TaxID=994334 RepID=A0A433D968_9FUNG|nr:hypothetical protein BC936DRAFT_145807 [Jimgerdemannia flammicorona]